MNAKLMNKAQAAGAQVAQHTSTPWVSTPGIGCGILYNIGPADTRPVLGVFHAPDKQQPILIAKANAEFIVKACNCHEELLQALRGLYEYANAIRSPGILNVEMKAARAAIAKAQGGNRE